jgi:flagellar motor switch protein FliN/FliY
MPDQQDEREVGGAAGAADQAGADTPGEDDQTAEAAEEPDRIDRIIERGEVEKARQDAAPPQEAEPMELAQLDQQEAGAPAGSIELLMDVDLDVKIELGRAQLAIEDILKLKKGSVVELDKLAGDPVDILVNERRVARGEILVVNDNFCVRITEILDPEARMKAGGDDDK